MATRTFFFISFLVLRFVLPAQDASDIIISDTNNIIKVKHRLLQRHADELQEKVDSFHTLHLVIAGNIYQTETHVNDAYNATTGRYDFKDELKYVQPLLNIGDISIANLKTSFADDTGNVFSSPDEFAAMLKYAGISAVMHANQQTANINKAALTRTRELLNSYDINHTGAFLNGAERLGNYPLILHKKGFTIAVLNYTYLANRPAISSDIIINEIEKFYIDHDMLLLRANKPDFTIVYFNWGDDKQEIPSSAQQELAQYVFERGANLVVGTNPNKPMQMDYMNYNYNGVPGEGIVAYSLGNLIASDDEIKNRNGYLLDIDLKKNEYTGKTRVDDWGVIPVYTYYDTTTVKGKTKIYSLPCWAIESGDVFTGMPYIEKRRIINGAYEVRQMLGSVADEIQYNLNELIVNNVMESVHLTRASLNNKFSQLREEDIKISLPPLPATYLPGSTIPLSLAKVSEQCKPKEEPPVVTAKSNKQTAYQKEKMKAENVFVPTPTIDKPKNNITSINVDTTANTAAKIPIAKASANSIGDTAIKLSAPIAFSAKGDTSKTPIEQPAAMAKGDNKNNATIPLAIAVKNDPAKAAIESPGVDSKSGSKNSIVLPPVVSSKIDTSSKTNAAQAKATTKSDIKNIAVAPPAMATKSDTGKAPLARPASPAKNEVKNTASSPPVVATKSGSKNATAATSATKNNAKNSAGPSDEARRKEIPVMELDPNTGKISTTANAEIKANLNKASGKQIKFQVDTFYRIQFYAFSKYVPLDTNYYTHLKGYQVVEENGLYKYLLGKYTSYSECYKYWKSQIKPRYKQSFIVKYIEGKRVIK